MLNLVLLFASIVLALAAGLMLKPVPAPAGALPILPFDKPVGFRIGVAAVLLSSLLVAGLIAVYSANPEGFRWAVGRPIDTILRSYHWLMCAGVGLYATLRLCGLTHRRSLWLFCLSLPGVAALRPSFFAALVAVVQ